MIVGAGESLRWLDRVLRLTEAWCDLLVAYCDAADDDTLDALHRHPSAVIGYGDGPLFERDESEVRNRLMALLDDHAAAGDLIVSLDADEELRSGGVDSVRGALETLPQNVTVEVEFRHAWAADLSQIRTDGGWAPAHQARIWRHQPGLRIPSRPLACGSVPFIDPLDHPRCRTRELSVLHLGYARVDDRVAKHARYQRIDGGRYHSPRHLQSILTDPLVVVTDRP
jgi:hypothetical protein